MCLDSPSGASLAFMHLGDQCPWSHWFRQQCSVMAAEMGAGLEDVDLTGRPGLAAPAQAYSSAQLVAPGYPPWPSPRPAADLRVALTRPVPQQAVAPVPPGPAASRQPVRVFHPEDGCAWQAAVAETTRLCLGAPPAGSDPEASLTAKLAWLKALASSGRGPLLFLAGAPAVAFLELIPVLAAHVPLPLATEGDLFLTCIHGTPLSHDTRPWLLASALACLRVPGAFREEPGRAPAVWAVSGRHAPYPNGPVGLFAAADFAEIMNLGRIWLAGGWDELVLVRYRIPDAKEGGR